MALQLNYTDSTGTTHSEAYVRLAKIQMNTTRCEFHAMIYHNAAARSKADAKAEKETVRVIVYHLVGTSFDTYIAESILKTEDKSLLTQLYAWLKTHVDTATDPTGNPNMGHDVDWTTATDV
tara:strand:+ start:1338 stop:1703 length:366 start_codon:yes stop_codon:yes gene_type:complete